MQKQKDFIGKNIQKNKENTLFCIERAENLIKLA